VIALYGLAYAVFVVTAGAWATRTAAAHVLIGLSGFIRTRVVRCGATPWFLLGAALRARCRGGAGFPQVLARCRSISPEHERPKAGLLRFAIGLAVDRRGSSWAAR